LAGGSAFIFTSDRVHQLVRDHRVKNVEMKRFTDVKIADAVVQRLNRAT
jgi:hypothetical protein